VPSRASFPVRLRPLALDLSPAEVAARLRPLAGFFFLDSADNSDGSKPGGELSIVGALPDEVIRGDLRTGQGRLRSALAEIGDAGQADFGVPLGGLFGSVEFDGSYCFGSYRNLLIFRHDRGEWLEVGELAYALQEKPPLSPSFEPLEFSQGLGRERFCDMVRHAKEYISAGDIYQVNLSQRFEAEWLDGADVYELYQRLRSCSPAPYSAFFDLGDRQVVSSSPECFLDLSGSRARTRPIKGTRPRFLDPGADQRSAYELMTSPKEIAELVMITDLERNDLGQVCEYGSVRVAELLKLERFAQVFHLVSTVEGELRPEIDHLAALSACFPGGSISGAPKRRALEIIDELEPVGRGLYTGAIGYLGANGESAFNIAIRTAVLEGGVLGLHTGAGIVADSDPDAEYDETLHKAAGVFAAAGCL
jgi:para-aminobenzoate synthetase component 1